MIIYRSCRQFLSSVLIGCYWILLTFRKISCIATHCVPFFDKCKKNVTLLLLKCNSNSNKLHLKSNLPNTDGSPGWRTVGRSRVQCPVYPPLLVLIYKCRTPSVLVGFQKSPPKNPRSATVRELCISLRWRDWLELQDAALKYGRCMYRPIETPMIHVCNQCNSIGDCYCRWSSCCLNRVSLPRGATVPYMIWGGFRNVDGGGRKVMYQSCHTLSQMHVMFYNHCYSP